MSDREHFLKVKEIYEELVDLGDTESIKVLQEQVYETYDITLEELCNVKVVTKRTLTLELCKAIARKYKTRSEWQQGDSGSYTKAHKKGWKEECCKHMERPIRKTLGYWTFDKVKESALRYNTKREWYKHDTQAYNVASRNNWLEGCYDHMNINIRKKNSKGYWSLERCKEESLKYNTKSEWKEYSKTSYNKAYANNWFGYCCTHMKDKPSIFEPFRSQIINDIRNGVSMNQIAKNIKLSRSGLRRYIKTHNLKEIALV